jgi:glycine hydroxymethyltransferase
MLDVHGLGGGLKVEKALEEAHIIGNKVTLPGDGPGELGGLRLGVNEVTRRGMSEKEMGQIADFASRVLVDQEDPQRVGEEVSAFMRGFNTVMFCFD